MRDDDGHVHGRREGRLAACNRCGRHKDGVRVALGAEAVPAAQLSRWREVDALHDVREAEVGRQPAPCRADRATQCGGGLRVVMGQKLRREGMPPVREHANRREAADGCGRYFTRKQRRRVP